MTLSTGSYEGPGGLGLCGESAGRLAPDLLARVASLRAHRLSGRVRGGVGEQEGGPIPQPQNTGAAT
jgi:hypothetical protein